MPRQFQIKNPFAKKSKNLNAYNDNATLEKGREEAAHKLAKLSGELKRLIKGASVTYTAILNEKNESKKKKQIAKLNRLVDTLNQKENNIKKFIEEDALTVLQDGTKVSILTVTYPDDPFYKVNDQGECCDPKTGQPLQ